MILLVKIEKLLGCGFKRWDEKMIMGLSINNYVFFINYNFWN